MCVFQTTFLSVRYFFAHIFINPSHVEPHKSARRVQNTVKDLDFKIQSRIHILKIAYPQRMSVKKQQEKHMLRKILKPSNDYALTLQLWSCKPLLSSCLQLNSTHIFFHFYLWAPWFSVLSRWSSLETTSNFAFV